MFGHVGKERKMRNCMRAAAWVMLTATVETVAFAQLNFDEPAGPNLPPWLLPVAGGAIVLILLVVVFLLFFRGRNPLEVEGLYLEPGVVGSRFEQLLAEIQGLTLRVQRGESKGYYRKIEQLVRVFLERIGHTDARHKSDEEIIALLKSGEVPQDMASSLMSIFERCKQGAIHETEKLDFSAGELLRDLRAIIKRAEQSSRS